MMGLGGPGGGGRSVNAANAISGAKKKSAMFKLMKLLKPQAGIVIFCCFLGVVLNLANLLKPYIMEIAVDDFITVYAGMGVEKVNPDAKVYVAVTDSWFSPEDEQAASDALIALGCDVLAQHVDTTAPQTASQANGTWSIGYNSDMSKETPDATLTSVIWNWSAFYTSYVSSIINATYDGSNYYGGMDESLVGLTALSPLCEEETAEIVNTETQRILKGEFGVFDGVLETNEGTQVGEEGKTMDDATLTGGINWYYRNVELVNWR